VTRLRTIEVTRFGGPEVLELRERPDPVAPPALDPEAISTVRI
jgi:hypothetical protein